VSGGAVQGGAGVATTARRALREGSLEASGGRSARGREHKVSAYPLVQYQRQEVQAAQQQAEGQYQEQEARQRGHEGEQGRMETPG